MSQEVKLSSVVGGVHAKYVTKYVNFGDHWWHGWEVEGSDVFSICCWLLQCSFPFVHGVLLCAYVFVSVDLIKWLLDFPSTTVRECGSSNAFGHVCLSVSVCPVCGLTFESLDPETSFLVCWYTSLGFVGQFYMSRSLVKVKLRGANVTEYIHSRVVRLGPSCQGHWSRSRLEEQT